MKYYYNDKLVRTSDRVYTHAVIDTKGDHLIACCGSYDLAQKKYRSYLGETENAIRVCDEKIKAKKRGYRTVTVKRFTYVIYRSDTEESITEEKEALKRELERKQKFIKVVELEARQ